MISQPLSQGPALPYVLALQARHRSQTQRLVTFVLAVPIVLYLCSLWTVRPFSVGETFSLSFATPCLFALSALIVPVSRKLVFDSIHRLRVEFALLAILVVLSFLSLTNSNAPIRSFRIIFPSLLPLAMLAHFTVIRGVSRDWLLRIPRLLIFSGLLFSVAPLLISYVVPIQDYFVPNYRFRGMFENAIQHGIVLGVLIPLIIVEFVLARKLIGKAAWAFIFALVSLALFKTGAKSAMAISLGLGVVFYGGVMLYTRNLFKIAMAILAIIAGAMFLWAFGLPLAEKLNPVIAEKIQEILEGGVKNYQSVESRQILWQTAISEGQAHWLVGSGAGEMIRGMSHAHNLVLDYFKGVGFFGAAAIVALCLVIIGRTCRKGLAILRGQGGRADLRIWACYVGATIYVLCNQMSDCFGPTTIGFLWIVYLVAVLAEDPAPSASALRPRPQGLSPAPKA